MFPYALLCFFFHGTATPEIYTLSLHDALPISARQLGGADVGEDRGVGRLEPEGHIQPGGPAGFQRRTDRKSTRLNSSHLVISYAVFCLKKKKRMQKQLII